MTVAWRTKSLVVRLVKASMVAVLVFGCDWPLVPPTNNTQPHSVHIEIYDPDTVVDTVGQSFCARVPCTPTYYTDTIICPPITPSPASALVGDSVTWLNYSSSFVTLNDQSGAYIVNVAAGTQSIPVTWSKAQTVTYSASNCTITGYNPQSVQTPQETIDIYAR